MGTHEYNKSISKYASIYIIFPKNTNQKEYTIGSKISKTRILSTNKWLMDNYIEGSIDTNILSASIFSYNDIQPGQIYTCIINKIIINTKKKKKNESILTTHEYNKSISKYASIYIIFPKNNTDQKKEYTIGSTISKT